MGVIGLIGATRPVLSWDEIATADVAHRPVTQIGHLVQHVDGVFAPYYLFMHLWTGLAGDSVLALRLPSILAMAVAVAAAGELGRQLFGAATGVVTGLLLCLIPNLSRYAAEARPYALACMFVTLSLVLLGRPGIKAQAAYGALVLGVGLSHLVALTTLVAHPVFLGRRARLGWAVSVAAPLVALLPLFWWGLHQRQTQLHWIPPLTAGAVYSFPERLTGSAPTAWLLIGLVLTGALIRRNREVVAVLAAAALPLLVVGAVSLAGPSFWVNRYLLFVLMPSAVVAAAGLTGAVDTLRLRPAVAMLAGPLAVFAAAGMPGQFAVRGPTVKNGSDYRTVAGVIRAGERPGDVVVYSGGRTMRAGVGYYLRHDASAPRDALMRSPGLLTAVEYPDPAVRLAGADRIWLVVYGRRADPSTSRRDLAPLLRTRFQRTGLWNAKGATLALYAPR
jgi:mannosyltransferase